MLKINKDYINPDVPDEKILWNKILEVSNKIYKKTIGSNISPMYVTVNQDVANKLKEIYAKDK